MTQPLPRMSWIERSIQRLAHRLEVPPGVVRGSLVALAVGVPAAVLMGWTAATMQLPEQPPSVPFVAPVKLPPSPLASIPATETSQEPTTTRPEAAPTAAQPIPSAFLPPIPAEPSQTRTEPSTGPSTTAPADPPGRTEEPTPTTSPSATEEPEPTSTAPSTSATGDQPLEVSITVR